MESPVILRDGQGVPQHAVLTWERYEALCRAAELSAAELRPSLAGVREWREHRGFSQAQLASLTGISRVYLSQIETGERVGTLEVMAGLARNLGCRIEDLLRRDIDPFAAQVAQLAGMPAHLQSVTAAIPAARWRVRLPGSEFSLLEQICHLRDIDHDGYRQRITRILNEDMPELPDLDGTKLAEERDYQNQDLGRVLTAFITTRAAIVERLRHLTPAERERTGRQEGVGVVTIPRMVAAMVVHDSEHMEELAALRRALGEGGV